MIGALNVAQTGLAASKYAVENVANNITNESTPGYKKRVVNFSEINNVSMSAGQGVGYDLSRVTSEFLYGNLVTETTRLSYNEEVSQILENTEALFSETDDSGFSANLNRYYQAVENMRSEPSNEIYQTDLANNGEFLVESMQKLYEGIERIQLVKEEELKANVTKVNSILNDIGEINEQMANYDEVSIEMLDKRDNLESELAKYVDIESTNYNNEYELKIAGQTAVRYSTNIRSIALENVETPQIDRFSVKGSDGIALDSIKNYEDENGAIQSQSYSDGDIVSYTFNATDTVSVQIGGTNLAGETITEDNLTRSLVLEINNNPQIRSYITAYNGEPKFDDSGNLIESSKDEFLYISSDHDGLGGKFDSRISIESIDESSNVDRKNIYKSELSSEEATNKNSLTIFGSEVDLSSGILKAQIEYTDSTNSANELESFKNQLDTFANTLTDLSKSYYKDDISGDYIYGEKAGDELYQMDEYGSSTANISISDAANISSMTINIGGTDYTLNNSAIASAANIGELAIALQTNIQTATGDAGITVSANADDSGLIFTDANGREFSMENFVVLDNATTPAATTDTITNVSEPNYEYTKFELDLFSGSNVKTMKFNSEVINSLDQTDLDYLASIQWKDDVSFDGKAQNPNSNDTVSMSEFYQSVRVSVSSQKESADFVLNTQMEVKQSLEATYTSIVSVDKDQEMTALIQFQAAYTASAKLITVVDEMLQTLLSIKR